MNIGRVKITLELLEEFIGLPVGHQITRVISNFTNEIVQREFEVFIQGPDCPEVKEGELVPEIYIEMEKIEAKITLIE